jgi:serine phosphatase RsbU (regulator of sigma subunit)
MAVLVLTNGNPAGQIIEITEPETLIGRLPKCAVVLDPHGVSREHAKILRKDADSFSIIDLDSRNKTKLNERVLTPWQETPLSQGDRINICDVELVFYLSFPQSNQIISNGDLTVTEGNEDSTIHTLDASRADLLLAGVVKPEVKLKAILEISRNLSSALKLEAVAPKILDSLVEVFGQAERAFMVLLKEDESKRWSIRQTFHKARPSKRSGTFKLGAAPADEARMSISRSIINHVLGQKKAVLSQDAGNDLDLPTSASIAELKIRSVMCAPLLTPDGQALGILQLDTSDSRQFKQDDLDVLLAVASQAAIAIQNASMYEGLLAQERIKRDLGLAQTIQVRFLPQTVPSPPGFEFFAHYHAAYEVGGDYYDFVELDSDHLAVALGDVAGKGVSAALMMAKFSGDTRACILLEQDPAKATNRVNRLLCGAGIEEKFITLSLGVLDVPQRRFTFCSAGHLPLIVRRANGSIEEIGESISGFPLGIDPDSSYERLHVDLNPGDVLVIHSDGVTDARNPREELYDSQANRRLTRRIAATAGGPGAVGRAILQDVREFSAGHHQADDITLVCFGPTG